MGAWDIGHFENDAAMDWVAEFSEQPSVQELSRVFDAVINGEAYIEADTGAAVLAAAEVIAAIEGKKSNDCPDDIAQITGLSISPALVSEALQAIDKVASADESELKELWAESDEYEAWQAAVADLKVRIG